MHAGEIFAEIVILAGLTVAGTWLIWIMIKAHDDLRRVDESSHGDVPHLHGEMRRAAITSPDRRR